MVRVSAVLHAYNDHAEAGDCGGGGRGDGCCVKMKKMKKEK